MGEAGRAMPQVKAEEEGLSLRMKTQMKPYGRAVELVKTWS
jgi:hypothetical protein